MKTETEKLLDAFRDGKRYAGYAEQIKDIETMRNNCNKIPKEEFNLQSARLKQLMEKEK